jgi:hypothetical protein
MSSQAPNFVPAGQVATTQQGYNVGAQAGSNYNSFNPYGSTTYGQTGTGPNGVPIYSTTQSLSPAQQSLLNTLQGGQQAAGTAGTNLITGANYGSTSPATAIGTMTSGLTGAATGQEVSYLKPYFTYQTQQLDTQLRNQGFDPSSPAYQQAMLNLQNSQGNQVEGFVAQTQPQMFQQATQEYQLPLTMGQQLAQWGAPNVAAATSAPGGAALQAPDYQGAVSQAENAGLQQESVNNQIWAGILGAVGNLGGGLIGKYGLPSFGFGGTASGGK